MATEPGPLLHVTTRARWRAWLARHHASAREIWLVSYKQHTGRRRLDYGQAVEEALCFGWIDSIVRRLDDDRAAQRFSPRKAGSLWSASNVERYRRMVAAARMTPAGAAHAPTNATIRAPIDNTAAGALDRLPPAIKTELMRHKNAWANFAAMAPGYRGEYVRWIAEAKRDETRERRIRTVVARLARNEKPGRA